MMRSCWLRLGPAVVAMLVLAGCADVELALDLRDGTHNHDPTTLPTHPGNPPTHPSGEVEDSYFSPIIRFPAVVLEPGVSGSKSHRIKLVFRDRDTGAPQFLLVDAKGTGAPFPETFSMRFFGEPDHSSLGPGIRLYAPIPGLTQARASGEVDMLLTGVIGNLDKNLYSVPLSCNTTDCKTGPHFPDRSDLTDDVFLFNGLIIGVAMEELIECSASFPDCEGVRLNGVSFHMLGGDILILGAASE